MCVGGGEVVVMECSEQRKWHLEAQRDPARRTFLVVQWIRSMLPMQGGWV